MTAIVVLAQRAPGTSRRHRWRATAYAHPMTRLVYRAVVLTAGTSVVLVGLVLVPLPGPGWLVVAVGLSMLAEDFPWAAGPARRLRLVLRAVQVRCARRWWGTPALLLLAVLAVLPAYSRSEIPHRQQRLTPGTAVHPINRS